MTSYMVRLPLQRIGSWNFDQKMAGWTGLEPAQVIVLPLGTIAKAPIWWLLSGSFLANKLSALTALGDS